jgi:hypothetical protein
MWTKPEDRVFVEALKPSDKLFVCTCGGCGYTREVLSLKEVKRVTGRYVVVEIRGNEVKFRKDNLEEAGRKFGRMYYGSSHDEIVEYKEPYISQYAHQKKEGKCARIIKFLEGQKLHELSDAVLDEYYTILSQFEKEQPAESVQKKEGE